MKLLFLFDDHLHAGPLLRAADELRKYAVELRPQDCSSSRRAVEYSTIPADAILIHQELLCDEILNLHKPVIILERIDGAQLARSRRWIDRPEVKLVLKGYCLHPPQLNNRYRGRVHAHLLRDAGVEAAGKSMAIPGLPSPQISPEGLAKIKPGYSFCAYLHMDSFARHPWALDDPRPIDVHFAGTTTYSGSEIEAHRLAAYRAARDWEQAHKGRAVAVSGRSLRKGEYTRTMVRSKCVLSPWGWGEAAFRDYEALFLGAVLIKPRAEHVLTWPPIEPVFQYLPCKPDFSDVPEIVQYVIDDWENLRNMRETNRKLAVSGWRLQRIAPRIAGLIKEAVATTPTR